MFWSTSESDAFLCAQIIVICFKRDANVLFFIFQELLGYVWFKWLMGLFIQELVASSRSYTMQWIHGFDQELNLAKNSSKKKT